MVDKYHCYALDKLKWLCVFKQTNSRVPAYRWLSPWLFHLNQFLFVGAMIIWGLFVIMDSPQFSALVARSVKGENTGSALTIVNSIGFLITIISIQLLNSFSQVMDVRFLFLILVPGPLFGLLSLAGKRDSK